MKRKKQDVTGIIFNKKSYMISDFNITGFIVKYLLIVLTVYIIVALCFDSFNIAVDRRMLVKIDLLVSLVLTVSDMNIASAIVVNSGLIYMLRGYIKNNYELLKNGIMTIMNMAYPLVKDSLVLPEADGFDKVMQNSEITVNMVAGIITVVASVIIAFVIGYLMSKILYGAIISLMLGILTLAGCKLNQGYIIVLILIFFMICAMSIGGNGRAMLGNRFSKKLRHIYINKKDSLYLIQLCIASAAAGIILFWGISGIYTVDTFEKSFKNTYSDNLKVTARDIAVMKYIEYKKFAIPDKFDSGQVGYQLYFRPTAKKIKSIGIKPNGNEAVLIKEFTGQDYVYRMNMWTDGAVENDSQYLNIDERNSKILDQICAQQNFNEKDDIVKSVADYLIENYEYSTEPQQIPYGKDFVNYFLEDTKSGNATHFASAAVLLYRSLGMPARYVSGYRIDYEQIVTGKYDRSSGEFNVDISAANAYSWVEVYTPQDGWTTVNVSEPPPMEATVDEQSEKKEPNTDINSYFRTIDKSKYSIDNIKRSMFTLTLKILCILVALLLLVPIVAILYKKIRKLIRFMLADNTQKASMLIENYSAKRGINTNSLKELGEYMVKKGNSPKKAEAAVTLAEKIMFSERAEKKDIKNLYKLLKSLK